MAHAAGIKVADRNDAVPVLFKTLFPGWFAGFAFAAIAIGALVPAAVMSIGASNLFTRNFWRAYVNPAVTPAGEAAVAKFTSLVVKLGALLAILLMPVKFAIDFQLLGGLCILQTFPAVVFGLFTRWFRAVPLLLGWAVGLTVGCTLAYQDGLVPVHKLVVGGTTYAVYVGLIAFVLNVAVAVVVNAVVAATSRRPAHAAE